MAPRASAGRTAHAAVHQPGKGLKLIAKSEGDTPLDLLGAGAPTGNGVVTVYTVVNGDEVIRHCTHFNPSDCTYKESSGGTTAKLVCKDGQLDSCTNAPPPVP